MNTHEIASKIAQILLETKAVQFSPAQPYQWASGWISPIYCDNRVTLSFPKYRTHIRQMLADRISHEFSQCDLVAGVATAGIPQGVLVAEQLGLPFVYVRSKPKDHGTRSQIEGRWESNAKVVLIEDLISTGESSLQAASALRQEGLEVLGVLSIFDYGFPLAAAKFANQGFRFLSLCTYSDLLAAAVEYSYLDQQSLDSLEQWRLAPESWLPATAN
ncbi:MAG: orotate phosphoribosyltransferase [Sphingomonadales bacterium]|nr:orotate phosphoribosyltransferase [Sphingomonadales bacterium]